MLINKSDVVVCTVRGCHDHKEVEIEAIESIADIITARALRPAWHHPVVTQLRKLGHCALVRPMMHPQLRQRPN